MDNDSLVIANKKDKETSTEFKQRRFPQWNENYFLYRDKILTNRLTQRQAVNVPIVRDSIQTWISKIDEPPILTFEARTRDDRSKDGEIIMNELWSYYYDRLKLDLLDNLEKKVVGLQGRGFKKWGFANSEIFCDIIDPYDIDIDPRANPMELNSADYVIHKNIFRSLRSILANKKYEQEGKNILKTYLDSKEGILRAAEVQEEYEKRQERLRILGAQNYDDYCSSDVLVELNESYKMLWDTKEQRFIRHLVVIAADCAVLYKKPLKDAIGISILPIVSWADDPDLNDIWCDGKADSVRTINKIVNIYLSQDLENRTYRNFGMYFFNTMNGTFIPRSFDPKPFGMYGVPGNPQEVVQQMRIEPLADTTNQIEYLKSLVQSSIAQTPTERGVANPSTGTLGEVELNLQQSGGRNQVTAKNYRRAWKESGHIFYELLNANSSGQITLYKKGADGEYRAKTIMPQDWQNPKGYECVVKYKTEQEADNQKSLEKAAYVQNVFQDNPVAMRIAKRKQLELLDWTAEEIDEAMSFYEQQQVQAMNIAGVEDPEADGATLSPMQMGDIEQNANT